VVLGTSSPGQKFRVLAQIHFSEERIASIFRVEEQGKQETSK
jgi:hypothetical protein